MLSERAGSIVDGFDVLLSMQFAFADCCEFFSEIKSNKVHSSSFLNIEMQTNKQLILVPKPFNSWFHPQYYFHTNCARIGCLWQKFTLYHHPFSPCEVLIIAVLLSLP